jgi:hypothetical protein
MEWSGHPFIGGGTDATGFPVPGTDRSTVPRQRALGTAVTNGT